MQSIFVINSPHNVRAPSRINDSLEFDGKTILDMLRLPPIRQSAISTCFENLERD